MNSFAVILLILNAVAMLTLPRRWAILPLLLGACYMTAAQSIDLGPFHFTVLRLLLLVGVIRALARGERLPGGLNRLDWLLLLWGGWAICSSVFHKPVQEVLVFRLGMVYNAFGLYFLIRIFCQTTEELAQLIKLTGFLLVPVALEMANEKLTHRNLFGVFGGVPEEVILRDEKFRAQGPFGHPILAGTVGAMCVPLMVGIWRQHRQAAIVGLAACLTMVVASTSSGPIMSVAFSVFALVLWRWRHLTQQMRIAAVVGYILLDLYMKDPAYFLMARVDLTGSSTGWYRAQLIRSAFQHLNEWWLVGTDYTRHWMDAGLPMNPDNCDMTNHYLYYGTWGGLPLMFIFIAALWVAFRYVGQALQLRAAAAFEERFLIWSIGAGLFSHAITCMSVAYFEQSVMFLYLNLAAIGSLHATALATKRDEEFSSTEAVHSETDIGLPSESFPIRSA
jgi:hypothetical protein